MLNINDLFKLMHTLYERPVESTVRRIDKNRFLPLRNIHPDPSIPGIEEVNPTDSFHPESPFPQQVLAVRTGISGSQGPTPVT